MAVAVGMTNALRTGQPMWAAVPDPGRANVISCASYLPGVNGSCAWAVDPREAGLAAGVLPTVARWREEPSARVSAPARDAAIEAGPLHV